jgi:hypothetical protein
MFDNEFSENSEANQTIDFVALHQVQQHSNILASNGNSLEQLFKIKNKRNYSLETIHVMEKDSFNRKKHLKNKSIKMTAQKNAKLNHFFKKASNNFSVPKLPIKHTKVHLLKRVVTNG